MAVQKKIKLSIYSDRTQETYRSSLGPFTDQVSTVIHEMNQNRIQERIWKHDHTVWKQNPSEIANRLGWLHSPELMKHEVEAIRGFSETIRSEGFQRVLLLGMGGSSLAPEVFRLIFGVKKGYPDLSVVDTTHPDAIRDWTERIRHEKTLFIVSTKSGTTVETLSLTAYFYNLLQDLKGEENAGGSFIAITDPGSALEKDSKRLGFRHIFPGDPEIGGRYSAISPFGLVPAAMIGMDLDLILDRACRFATKNDFSALHLGVSMGILASAGKDKLSLLCSNEISPFGAWVEQLIAESSGKEGKGILPVTDEPPRSPNTYDMDRFFIHIRLKSDVRYNKTLRALKTAGFPVIEILLNDPYDICSEFFRWEMAVAIAGSCLKINPFDQPDVESSKVRSRKIIEIFLKEKRIPEITADGEENGIAVFSPFREADIKKVLMHFFSKLKTKPETECLRAAIPYVSIHAYANPNPELSAALQKFRLKISKRFRVAVTIGYGPRFLHSTGQLHKGDAGRGLFIQLTGESGTDFSIPDRAGKDSSAITFGLLINSQAIGDRQALQDAGRTVIRFHFKRDFIRGIDYLLHQL